MSMYTKQTLEFLLEKEKGKKVTFFGEKNYKASNQEVYVDFLPARKSEFCPMRRRH